MKGSFAKRLVITIYFLLIAQEVNPLVLKKAGKRKISSDLDGEVRLKLINEQGKRYIENEKGKATGHDVSNYEQHAQERRGGVIVGVLLGIELLATTASFAWDVYLAEHGCCGITDACTTWDEYEKLAEELDSQSDEIDTIYKNANNENQYATTLNIISQVLWLKLSYFNEFATSYLTLLDEEFFEKLDEKSAAIKEEVESANSELEDFDVVVEEYETQFDDLETTLLTLAGIFTATGVSLVSGLVNYHSKNYASSLTLNSGVSSSISYTVKARQFSGLYSSIKYVRLEDTFTSRFDQTTDVRGAVTNNADAALSIIGTVTQIWAITQNIEECNEIADNAREALTQLKEYEVISDELLVNVTWLYDNTTEIYNLLRDQVRDESIIVWASEIKELAAIADPENTTLVEAEQYIQAYIDGIATADKDETAELTQKLIEGISNITTELTCLSYELALLQHSATQCSEGSDNITTLYDEMSASWASSVCTENDNIDFSKFLGYVETKMGNLGKQTECILNNAEKLATVCELWYTDELPDSNTADELGLTDTQVEYFISVCPLGSVYGKTVVEDGICTERYANSTINETLTKFYKYNDTEVSAVFYACPSQDVADVAGLSALICDKKLLGYDVDSIISDYPFVNETQINEAYENCVIGWICTDENQICEFVDLGFTLNGSFESVYEVYEDKYGTDEVQAKINECLANPDINHCAQSDSALSHQSFQDTRKDVAKIDSTSSHRTFQDTRKDVAKSDSTSSHRTFQDTRKDVAKSDSTSSHRTFQDTRKDVAKWIARRRLANHRVKQLLNSYFKKPLSYHPRIWDVKNPL